MAFAPSKLKIPLADKKARLEDPSGKNPRSKYFNSPSTNKEVLGQERTELEMPVQSENVQSEPEQTSESQLDKIQVNETPGGITIVLDDTPENKRVVIKHPEGGGIELMPDGGVKIVSMKGKLEVIKSDVTIVVGGDATLEYQGNLDMKVAGEFNIDCLDFNLTTRGNKSEKIIGSEDKIIGRGSSTQITGNKATYVTESVVETYLGGHEHNVKGEFNHNIDGAAGFFASGDVDITSETDVNVSSPNTTVSGDKLSVMGGTGQIGGQAINYTGNGAVFQKGVTAPTFHGDLDGTATTSTVTQSQTYGEASQGSAGSITNTATPTFPQINADMVTAYNGSEYGIKEVTIDEDDDMKKFIDQSSTYQGVHHTKPTVRMARSAMRDPANRNNKALTNAYIANNVIDESYSNPTPPEIGRIVTEKSTPILAAKSPDIFRNDAYATYVAKRKFANITPEDKYNPFLKEEITAKTKLNDSVSIAKFLGTEDPTNLKFLRDLEAKQQLAKYLYVHGTAVQRILDNNLDFKGISFVVSEGVYRPGPTETPAGLNDLKLKGQAIVFKAVNSSGKESNSALFDIAVYLKDNAYFKEMILSYDTLEGYNNIASRLIMILPDIDDDWYGIFDRKVTTEFNGQKLSQGELVEVLPYKTEYISEGFTGKENTPDGYPHHGLDQTLNPPSIGYDGISNGKLDPAKLIEIAPASSRKYGTGPLMLQAQTARAWFDMKAAAAADGIELIPTSAYRSYYYQKRARIEHRAKDPNYTIATEGRSNHGLGLAVDIAIPGWSRNVDPSNLPVWKWLNENAGRYGFKQKASLKFKDAVHWSRTPTGG